MIHEPILGYPAGYWVVSLLLSLFVACWLHELGHWTIGKLGGSEPKILRNYWILPYRVKHNNVDEFPDALIRLSGFSPFIWIPPGILAFIWFILEYHHPLGLLIGFSFILVVTMASESDAIAMRDPERFRRMDKSDEFPGNSLFFPNWL